MHWIHLEEEYVNDESLKFFNFDKSEKLYYEKSKSERNSS